MIRALCAAAAASSLLALSAAASPRPNIIVVMLDDVTDDLSFMPRTTALLADGTRYTNSFVGYPLCGPSRATFLTGQEARTHGVTDNGMSLEPVGLMPQALRAAGYRTAIIGKRPNGFRGSMAELGFDAWATIERRDRYFGRRLDTDHGRAPIRGYTPDRVYGRALGFAKRTPGPYFLWVSAIGAHAPAEPAPRHRKACDDIRFKPGPAFNEADLSDKPHWFRPPAFDAAKAEKVAAAWRDQCAVLQADDEWIARLVRLAGPDTCVFLTADNGRLHGQHRATGKLLLFEESIRVPLVMWGCGAARGAVDGRLVSNVDLPATILALAQAPPGRKLDGISLLGPERRAAVRLMGRWGGNETAGHGHGRSVGVVTVGWRFFEHEGGGGAELYEMGRDRPQQTSRADEAGQSARVRRMRQMLEPR
jgi:N-acetylglucosamine-6-sulfatase